jgi:hypothetical protein
MSILSKTQLKENSRMILNSNRNFSEAVIKDHDSLIKSSAKSSVFLSHKHSDGTSVKQMRTLLYSLGADVYIDWLDPDMPEETKGETAIKIKVKINQNDKFILLATENAIESKWCNWELGYGDAHKYPKNKIALFPLREDNSSWKGNEYMEIYHIIEYEDGNGKYDSGRYIPKGYYVFTPSENNKRHLTPLKEWLEK